MAREHIDHSHVVRFAEERVNLPREKAKPYREQVRRLRKRLEAYLAEHPDFTLAKMLLSGSLAKATALRTLNDIDVSAYVRGDDAPQSIADLLEYLAERLRKVFPNIKPEQVVPQTYSVKISFRGTGLDVDVVPIIYYGDPEWRGDLISQDDGSRLMTSIPLHLDFISQRKKAHERHFAQVVRLVKFWSQLKKQEDDAFRFKSFMVELILAHLSDSGQDFTDYPEALTAFFTYLAKSDLSEKIVFLDNYRPSAVPNRDDPVQIIDPVNPDNNVSRLYTRRQADAIVDAALDAGDAIDAALRAPTKGLTVEYWRQVFGTTFHA